MSKTPRVGLKDIAKQTGVSSAAVSLVLNNRPGVSPETRKRVSAVAHELGYEPRRRRDSAVLSPTVENDQLLESIGFYAFGVNAALGHSYYGDILSSASTEARKLGAKVGFEAFDGQQPDGETLPLHGADGLLITGRPPKSFIERLQRNQTPYVLVCCSLAHLPGDTIGPENIESSYEAIRYLANLGHRRIAYLGGEPNNADARERYLGYRWAVEDLGLEDQDSLAMMSFFDTEHGSSGLHQLLQQAGSFTALYAASDFLAMGVYRSAREMGISIPDELSIVGFDNNAHCETLHPSLTTLGLDRHAVGRVAVERLVELVRQPQASRVIRIPATLIKRQSCRSLR